MACGMLQEGYFPSRWVTRTESNENLHDRVSSVASEIDSYCLDCIDYHFSEPVMTLEDIRSQYNSCYTCGVSWSDNHTSLDCGECGGYSLTCPCPVCDGVCDSIWQRDVSMSHSMRKAHWEGECKLSEEERSPVPAYLSEDVVVQGLEDLTVSS